MARDIRAVFWFAVKEANDKTVRARHVPTPRQPHILRTKVNDSIDGLPRARGGLHSPWNQGIDLVPYMLSHPTDCPIRLFDHELHGGTAAPP